MYALVGWLEFNVPFQHKYGYIRDDQQPLLEANAKVNNNSYAHDDQGDNPGQENRGLDGVLYKL